MVRTGEWINEAWALVREDFWMHALIALIFAAIHGTAVGTIITGPLMVGYMHIILEKLRNRQQALNINGLSLGFDRFLDGFLAWLLIGIFTGLGSLACFVGAIVVAALMLFTYPLIADRQRGFWEAISESYEVAKNQWFGLSVFVLVIGILTTLISALTCGLGYFVAFPLMQVAIALAYRDNFTTATSAPLPRAGSVRGY